MGVGGTAFWRYLMYCVWLAHIQNQNSGIFDGRALMQLFNFKAFQLFNFPTWKLVRRSCQWTVRSRRSPSTNSSKRSNNRSCSRRWPKRLFYFPLFLVFIFSLFLLFFLSCLGGSQPQLPPAQSGRVRVLLCLIRLVYQLSLKEKKKTYQLCLKSLSQV